MKQGFARFFLVGLATASLVACGSDDNDSKASECSVDEQTGCDSGKVCENVTGGGVGCFAPVIMRGRVVQSANPATGVAGSIVVARDINGALVSRGIDATDQDGRYELTVPAERASDGTPKVAELTLRADAQGFATFPSGLRVALPVDTTKPVNSSGKWVIENPSTDIALDRLPSDAGLGTVRGFVRADEAGGTLIVSGAASALAGSNGAFTLFNVPSGSAEIRGYKAGLQLDPATATVSAGATVEGIELKSGAAPLGSVSGSVSFVNAGTNQTSVVLVVKSTFNAALARGEVPVGLRQFPVSGQYAFEGVPIGEYVVLAAFENDELVRDPDLSIGGTSIQSVSVASAPVSVPGFKITGALDVMAPGATEPEVVTGTPTFRWADDSSEDGYEVTVYDTFGNEIFHDPDVARVTGSPEVSLAYQGPALTPGYYQFRAVSWRAEKGTGAARTYISSTEDLKGVFVIR
ncbi:MAG: hypothetical protein ACOY0T_15085 [Myxococcota bacterium]